MNFGNEDKTPLSLEQLIDNANNELTVYVSKSVTRKPTAEENAVNVNGNDKLLEILGKTSLLIPDPAQLYKIHFKDYILYQMRNESFTVYKADESHTGYGLVLFEKSALLDHVYEFINMDLALSVWKKTKYQHYGIYTLNNIIDVISFEKPTIEKVERV